MTDPGNNGLTGPIATLNPVVQEFANDRTGVTRADIYALATVVAVAVGHHVKVSKPVSFTMPWYGRKNCKDLNNVCLNATGLPVPCTETRGPYRNLPSVNLNSSGLLQYLADTYGYNDRQSVAIMGGHAVGAMTRSVRWMIVWF